MDECNLEFTCSLYECLKILNKRPEKSGNFKQTGKIRKNHTKYWKTQGISNKCYYFVSPKKLKPCYNENLGDFRQSGHSLSKFYYYEKLGNFSVQLKQKAKLGITGSECW